MHDHGFSCYFPSGSRLCQSSINMTGCINVLCPKQISSPISTGSAPLTTEKGQDMGSERPQAGSMLGLTSSVSAVRRDRLYCSCLRQFSRLQFVAGPRRQDRGTPPAALYHSVTTVLGTPCQSSTLGQSKTKAGDQLIHIWPANKISSSIYVAIATCQHAGQVHKECWTKLGGQSCLQLQMT